MAHKHKEFTVPHLNIHDPEESLGYQMPSLRNGPSIDGHVRARPSLDQLDHSGSPISEYNSYTFDHQEG